MKRSNVQNRAGVVFDSDRTARDLAELHDALNAYHTTLSNASAEFTDGIAKLKGKDQSKVRKIKIAA